MSLAPTADAMLLLYNLQCQALYFANALLAAGLYLMKQGVFNYFSIFIIYTFSSHWLATGSLVKGNAGK